MPSTDRLTRVSRGPIAAAALCLSILSIVVAPLGVQSALAQTQPRTMRLEGAPSQTSTGALRCAPNESAQLALIALDESLNRTLVADYAPEARSTDERVVVARVSDNAASTVNVLCVGDGEAWITVEAAGLRVDMPVLVGTARRKATPAGPPPDLAGAAGAAGATSTAAPAPLTPTTTTVATAPVTRAPLPANTTVATGVVAPTAPTAETTTTAPQTVTSVPVSPLRATIATLPRKITTPTLELTGRYMPDRAITAPTLTLTGRYMPDRTITTPRLTLTGTAPQ